MNNNMKKYFILAAAAIVAMAACSKMENDYTSVPDKKISFEVASYLAQTKAAGDASTSLNAEGYTTFNTYANFFPENGDVQAYMTNVAVNFTAGTPNVWAPARDYYWPKTGWINFYSYAGSQAPTITFDSGKTTATAAYTDKTIGAADNFLLADAALKQNGNRQDYVGISGVAEGVPTLFRHQLAKLDFKIKLATTDAKKSASNSFKVTVLNAGTNVSNIKADSKGSLTLTNTVDGTTSAHTLVWSDVKVWTPSATPVIETMDFNTVAMTLPVNTKEINEVSLLDARTIMPQALDTDNDFTLTYKVETFCDAESTSVPYMTEIITVTGKIATLVNTITAWNKNTKITYHISIDPIGNKITFDPAVEEWATAEGSHSF